MPTYERLDAVGYPISAGTLFPGENTYLHKALGAEGVDVCMSDPGFREFVLQPAWMDAGWHESTLLDGTAFGYGTPVLTGPDGPVEAEIRGLGEWTYQTLSVLPLAPLAPDADYTFTTRVGFGPWEQAVDVGFHTVAG